MSDELIEVIHNHKMLSNPDKARLVELIRQRDALGRQRYGQPLMSNDGRSGVQDAKEELGDLLQYAMKCRLNGTEDLEELKELLRTTVIVLNSILQ